jgi:pilus assembly protein Flp/PilA
VLFLSQQDGQGLVEYALILVLVSLVVVLLLVVLGPQVGHMYSQVTSALEAIT